MIFLRSIVLILLGMFLLTMARAQDDSAPTPEQEAAMKVAQERQKDIQRNMAKLMPKLSGPIARIMREHGDSFQLQMAAGGDQAAFREHLALTVEQVKGYEKLEKNMQTRMQAMVFPMIMKVADAKTDADYDALAGDIEKQGGEIMQSFQKQQDEILTPVQKTKLGELGLQANQGNMPGMISFKSYEILDLGEEQRKELGKIRDEYYREMETLMDKMFAIQAKHMVPPEDEDELTPEQRQEKNRQRMEKMQEEGRGLEQEGDRLNARTKAKLLALLTAEQRKRFEEIVAQTPEFLSKRFRKPTETEDDEEWKKSWKPGDPVPENAPARKPRGGFPSGGLPFGG